MKRALTLMMAGVTLALLPVTPAHAEAGKDDEQELLALVNSARSANGLPAVRMDGRLQNDSRAWSEHILKVNFEHDTNMPWYDCSLRSENIAYGHRTVASVHSDFMNSPSHRANVLRSNVNVVGFGVSYRSDGSMYTVERFYNCPNAAEPQYTSGAIKNKWLALGGQPNLGRYQATPGAAGNGGQYQLFGGGSDTGVASSAIYWHPNVDQGRAHVTFGPFWLLWEALGYENGVLRYPTGDPYSINYCRSAANPYAQAFQGGIIEWSAATGAHALVPGKIADKFIATKGHCGPAGLPTSEVFDWPGFETSWQAQMFEYRYIALYKPTNQVFVCTYQGVCT